MKCIAQLTVAVVISCAAVSAQQGPPMPKPGPEHDILKMDVGTWDAVIELVPAPGAPPQKSKGVETARMGCGGLCLISDFKSEMMGAPFEGHGVMAWDSTKKKYTGVWMDSMSAGIALTEGTYDPKAKKWTSTMEGPDMTGKVVKTRATSEMRSPTERVFTMYSPGADGKEMEVMKITYTKRQ